MTWDEVIAAHVAQLNADATIIATIGADRIWPALDSRVPPHFDAIEWQFLDDFEEEVFNPLLVQWDLRTQSAIGTTGEHAWTRAATVERAMRRLMHYDVYRVIGGIYMRSQLDSARTIPVAEPHQYHRQLDFVYEPLRSKYPVGPTS